MRIVLWSLSQLGEDKIEAREPKHPLLGHVGRSMIYEEGLSCPVSGMASRAIWGESLA